MFGLGTGELLLILVVLVVLFGASRIPQLGEALGKGIRSFRRASDAGAIDVTPEKQHTEEPGRSPGGAQAPPQAREKKG